MPSTKEARQTGPVLGHLTLTVVSRVHEPIYGGGTGTIGEAVDEFLARAAVEGKEVMKAEFEMTPEQWHGIAPTLAEQYRDR